MSYSFEKFSDDKDFDFDKFLEEWIKKNTKPKTLWDKISLFFRNIY